MSTAHPDTIQTVVRPLQVGFRYEITSRSVYVLSAKLAFYTAPALTSFPHASLDDLSAINANIFTTADPDAQREGEDKWSLTLGRGLPMDEKVWPEGRALYMPYGLYIGVTGAEADAAGSQVLLTLEYVDRDHYCPARQTPADFYRSCGPAPAPGPAEDKDPWSNQGQEIAQFLVTLGSGKTITALEGTGIATL